VGVQLEAPSEDDILNGLDKAVSMYPDVKLLVMSEYSLSEPPTNLIRAWCLRHERYLIIGGVEPLNPGPDGKTRFADTAYVIDPSGRVVFSQGKSVPIQFMADGVPAEKQAVWESPWGKIGIAICYDMAYSRVMDGLIRKGAQMVVVPAMDAKSWGEYEHEMHSRITTVRAAEYGVPIFRVASSGISQAVNVRGRELSRAGFAVREGTVMTELTMFQDGQLLVIGRLPLDRHVAIVCVEMTGIIALILLARATRDRIFGTPDTKSATHAKPGAAKSPGETSGAMA